MSREFTQKEMQDKFLYRIRAVSNYWKNVSFDEPLSREEDLQRRLDGLVHSVLCVFDGCSMDLPALNIIPDPHPDDKQYHLDNGENYWPTDKAVNFEQMHEIYFERFK